MQRAFPFTSNAFLKYWKPNCISAISFFYKFILRFSFFFKYKYENKSFMVCFYLVFLHFFNVKISFCFSNFACKKVTFSITNFEGLLQSSCNIIIIMNGEYTKKHNIMINIYIQIHIVSVKLWVCRSAIG